MITPFAYWLALLSAAATAPEGPRWQVEAIGEQPFTGMLERIERGRLFYRAADRSVEILLDDVLRISVVPTPAAAPSRQPLFYLSDGSRFSGVLAADGGGVQASDPEAVKGAGRVVCVRITGGTTLRVPFDSLAAVRLAPMADDRAQAELESRLANRSTSVDHLIVVRDGKVTVLPGALEELGPDGWRFRVGNRLTSAGLDAAYAIVLGGRPPAALPPARFELAGGDCLLAEVISADARSVRVHARPLGEFEIPWARIADIHLRSGRVQYVSELEPENMLTRSILSANWPPRRDRNVTGGPIRIAGRAYERGLGVHAFTRLTYRLDGEYERFSAAVGIDDSVSPHGGVVFRVLVDARKVFEATRRGGQPPEPVSVNVRGAKRLTLECDEGDDLDFSDHADWADALLIRIASETVRRERP